MDRSVSGPLSISAAAAAVAENNEQEEELTNPVSLAEEDEEGLSESEVSPSIRGCMAEGAVLCNLSLSLAANTTVQLRLVTRKGRRT